MSEKKTGKGEPEFLPDFKSRGRPSPVSASDMNQLVRAIRPLQRIIGRRGVEIVRGENGVVIQLSKEVAARLGTDEATGVQGQSAFVFPFKVTQIEEGSFNVASGVVETRVRSCEDVPTGMSVISGTDSAQGPPANLNVFLEFPGGEIETSGAIIYLRVLHDASTEGGGVPVVDLTDNSNGHGTGIYFGGGSEIIEYFPIAQIFSGSFLQLATANFVGYHTRQVDRGGIFTYSNQLVYYPGDLVSYFMSGSFRWFMQTNPNEFAIWNLSPFPRTETLNTLNWTEISL